MKKFLLAVLLIGIMVFAQGCATQEGTAGNVKVDTGKSLVFADVEIKAAAKVVKENFASFAGCKLTKIWYDEDGTREAAEQVAQESGLATTDVIILDTAFEVGDGALASYSEDGHNEDWQFTLSRSNNMSDWEIVDDGRQH